MGLKEDIKNEMSTIFISTWTTKDGRAIPSDTSIKLDNDAIKIKAAVLYADLADSTTMVQNQTAETAAEIYKAFLKASCKVIRHNGGEITAFDGDRVMAVFIGDTPNTDAAQAALNIHYIVSEVVEPEFKNVYKTSSYQFDFAVGVDSGDLFVAKTGIRNANDLVWVGNAANIAAKLCSLRSGNTKLWITERVFNAMNDSSKYSNTTPKNLMWEPYKSAKFGLTVYGSCWWRSSNL